MAIREAGAGEGAWPCSLRGGDVHVGRGLVTKWPSSPICKTVFLTELNVRICTCNHRTWAR